MKVTNVSVSAGRTFNHPFESYSNLRPYVKLEAMLDDGEDAAAAVLALQAKAERLVEDHKANLLESLERIHEVQQVDRELENLERQITQAQGRLTALREQRRLPLGEPQETV